MPTLRNWGEAPANDCLVSGVLDFYFFWTSVTSLSCIYTIYFTEYCMSDVYTLDCVYVIIIQDLLYIHRYT